MTIVRLFLAFLFPGICFRLFLKDNSIGYTDPSDASSLIWRNISGSQRDYIGQLASNLELLRKSKEDARADRLARDLEGMDFEDLDMDDSLADDDVVDMLPYVLKTMTESELFQAFYSIRLRWESLACGGLQPVTLLNPILGPIPNDCLKADRSLSYVHDAILKAWRSDFKMLSKTVPCAEEHNSTAYLPNNKLSEDAVYEPVISERDCDSYSINFIKSSLVSAPSLEAILFLVQRIFTPNDKQTLIIKKFVSRLYGIVESRAYTAVDSNDQFLLYVGGCLYVS
jgi:hypothetical protein